MTPSKCRDTDGVGNASPGPGRKCLREFGARDEDWYAFSSGLTSTVIRTRYDCVVYTAHDTLQPPNTTTRTHATYLDDDLAPVGGPLGRQVHTVFLDGRRGP